MAVSEVIGEPPVIIHFFVGFYMILHPKPSIRWGYRHDSGTMKHDILNILFTFGVFPKVLLVGIRVRRWTNFTSYRAPAIPSFWWLKSHGHTQCDPLLTMSTDHQPLLPILNHYYHVVFYDFLWKVQVAASVGREVTWQLVWMKI